MRIQVPLLFVLMFVLVACGQPSRKFANFEHFEGTWVANADGKVFSETWKTEGQRMYGQGYLVKGKDTLFGEKLAVEWINDKLVYIADVPGQDPVLFTAKEQGKVFRFENNEHDFPQQIIYIPEGKNELRVLLKGIENGQSIKEEISFKR